MYCIFQNQMILPNTLRVQLTNLENAPDFLQTLLILLRLHRKLIELINAFSKARLLAFCGLSIPRRFVFLWFNIPVNNYGHVETVSYPNHTFPGQA